MYFSSNFPLTARIQDLPPSDLSSLPSVGSMSPLLMLEPLLKLENLFRNMSRRRIAGEADVDDDDVGSTCNSGSSRLSSSSAKHQKIRVCFKVEEIAKGNNVHNLNLGNKICIQNGKKQHVEV